MPDFVIAYQGGQPPATKEEGAAHMAKWQQWIADLGEDAVNPGTPLGASRIVSADGVSEDGGDNPMSGFSVVRADDMNAAIEIAKACPFLETGGTLEVAQVMKMG